MKPGLRTFSTTAARAAYAVVASDLGDIFQDQETGGYYMAVAEGASIANWRRQDNGTQGYILFSVHDFRECDANGDFGAIAANGGILASDTTPILRGNSVETSEISWAAANVDPISAQRALPADLDDTRDVTVTLWVYTDNAGGGGIDAATFTVETGWGNAALVSDTATDGTPATTIHTISATVAAADVPASAGVLTVALTPAAHGNDPTQLLGMRVAYFRT